MRAGISVERLSARTGIASHSPMKNYRPAFESIILNRNAEGLDAGMVRTMGGIIRDAFAEADRKGAGEKVREVFRDFASRIDNDIVKLASQRIRDAVAGVRTEHLQDFLSEMHGEMLKNPDRADAIPEAMLRTYQMTGGKVSAAGIAMAVRAGFAKSKTLCPKEVSQEVRREYESGSLDYIGEIAQARATDSMSQWAYAALPAQSAANDVRLEIPQSETAAQALPEAIPIVHFQKTSKPDDTLSQDRISQAVPEIVATYHREKARRTKEEARPRRPDIPQVAIAGATPARGQAILLPKQPARTAHCAGEEKRADERPEKGAERRPERKETAGERESVRPAPEAKKPDRNAPEKTGGSMPRLARKENRAAKVAEVPKKLTLEKTPARKIRATEKRRMAEPAKREKKRKAGMQFERAPVRKNSKKPRDALAPFKPRSERIRKGKAPSQPERANKAKAQRSHAAAQKRRPAPGIAAEPRREGRNRKRPGAAVQGTGRTERRPRAKTIELRAREKKWKCSMTVRQAQAGPHQNRKSGHAPRRAAPARRKRPIIGDIIFKLGIQSRPWLSVRRSR